MTKFIGVECRKMRPTSKHRPAVWESMLGTVNAMDDDGTVRYFDYDYDAALAFAGVTSDRDPRLHRVGIRLDGRVIPNASQASRQPVVFITKQGA